MLFSLTTRVRSFEDQEVIAIEAAGSHYSWPTPHCGSWRLHLPGSHFAPMPCPAPGPLLPVIPHPLASSLALSWFQAIDGDEFLLPSDSPAASESKSASVNPWSLSLSLQRFCFLLSTRVIAVAKHWTLLWATNQPEALLCCWLQRII